MTAYDVTNNSGTQKYDNNGMDGYFWFDDDNNMSYRYIQNLVVLLIKVPFHPGFKLSHWKMWFKFNPRTDKQISQI